MFLLAAEAFFAGGTIRSDRAQCWRGWRRWTASAGHSFGRTHRAINLSRPEEGFSSVAGLPKRSSRAELSRLTSRTLFAKRAKYIDRLCSATARSHDEQYCWREKRGRRLQQSWQDGKKVTIG